MNKEQLQAGKALSSKIDGLKEQLDFWKQAKDLSVVQLKDLSGYGKQVNVYYIDFKVLKTLTISEIENALTALEKEFTNL